MQPELILRSFSTPYATHGYLKAGGLFECYTLELPWLDNVTGISCIPAGVYQCRKHVSPSKGPCIAVDNVPGRSHILIHSGNFTRNTRGCILVGVTIADINSDKVPDVVDSVSTMKKLLDAMPKTFTLEVRRCL